MNQPPDRQTLNQRRLAALAAALVAANVDAAQVLGELLIHEARARKRVEGLALVIRWNTGFFT